MHTYISNTHMHCFKCLSNRLLNSILSTWPKFVQWRKNLVWIPLPPFLFCFENKTISCGNSNWRCLCVWACAQVHKELPSNGTMELKLTLIPVAPGLQVGILCDVCVCVRAFMLDV